MEAKLHLVKQGQPPLTAGPSLIGSPGDTTVQVAKLVCDLRRFRATRWQFPKHSSVTNIRGQSRGEVCVGYSTGWKATP
ncbi:hypothetical protein NQZ68_005387 [Dissostichus eleginoides]|nr:hypothetical protein NQZ68_005387 [Dissostichus eleginoides]